jgi:WD40 repeat protein
MVRILHATYSTNDELLATVTDDDHILVYSTTDWVVVDAVSTHDEFPSPLPAWHPIHNQLLYVCEHAHVWDLSNGCHVRQRFQGVKEYIALVAWFPCGKRIALVGNGMQLSSLYVSACTLSMSKCVDAPWKNVGTNYPD